LEIEAIGGSMNGRARVSKVRNQFEKLQGNEDIPLPCLLSVNIAGSIFSP
jgi:hypothetical protein